MASDQNAQANCWFMVSFLYECLGEVFHGSVFARFLYLREGSEEIRHEIRIAARLVVSFPFEEVVCIIPPRLKLSRLHNLTRHFVKAIQSHSAI